MSLLDPQAGLPTFLQRRTQPAYAQMPTGLLSQQAYQSAGPFPTYQPAPVNVRAPLAPWPEPAQPDDGGTNWGQIGGGLLAALGLANQAGALDWLKDRLGGGSTPGTPAAPGAGTSTGASGAQIPNTAGSDGLSGYGSQVSLDTAANAGSLAELMGGALPGSAFTGIPLGPAVDLGTAAAAGSLGEMAGLGGPLGGSGGVAGFTGTPAAGSIGPVMSDLGISPFVSGAGSAAGAAGGLLPGFAASMESAALAPVVTDASIAALVPQPSFALGGSTGLGGLGTAAAGLGLGAGLAGAYEGIRTGNEGMAGLGGALAGASGGALAGLSGLAALGPLGLLGAGVGALGASLVNTKEYGDKAFENYWTGVESGRGMGESSDEELAQGFVNLYRTNKWDFPGQQAYGRTGNEDFLYDMQRQINAGVESGAVPPDATPDQVYASVVKPWLATLGGGSNADPRFNAVQDYMLTDIVGRYMAGRPISNAQIKGDTKFAIVSNPLTYAGRSLAPTPQLNVMTNDMMPTGLLDWSYY